VTVDVADRRRRRWPWVIGGVVAVLVALAGLFWYVFVPNWRPPLRDGERYGVDVSAHQGEIDWRRVAADDIEFAYLKASEGGGFTDSRFGQNWTAAGEVGLDRGAYHFFTLCRPGGEQARHFLAVAPPDPRALPPAVDLELAGNCSRRPPASQVEAELRAFLEIVEAAWHQPALLYVGDDWESRYPVRTRLDRPLWQSRFLRRPNLDTVRIWQIHGFAHVEGIPGRVDLNIMRPATDSQVELSRPSTHMAPL
jgi:lysozyme